MVERPCGGVRVSSPGPRAALACAAYIAGRKKRELVDRGPYSIPDPRLWRDVEEVTIRPALVTRVLLDGACFFAALPLLDALAEAHADGVLPALLSLP